MIPIQICKFITEKWMNPHVIDVHNQPKKSPHQHSETWTWKVKVHPVL